jgi:uncharacterized protein YggE
MTDEQAARDPHPLPTVLALGEGAVDAAPDAARVVIGVQVAKSGLAAARGEAASRVDAAIAAVKAAGIDAWDIQTSGYRVRPLRDIGPDGHPTTTRGYEVRNAVTVTVRDLDALPAVLDAATAAGANQVQGPEFFLQHPEEATDEARRLAMATARRHAELLAAAEGATLGRVRSIVDRGTHGGIVPRVAYRAMAMADSTPATPIEAGVERITASVEVVWDLV